MDRSEKNNTVETVWRRLVRRQPIEHFCSPLQHFLLVIRLPDFAVGGHLRSVLVSALDRCPEYIDTDDIALDPDMPVTVHVRGHISPARVILEIFSLVKYIANGLETNGRLGGVHAVPGLGAIQISW